MGGQLTRVSRIACTTHTPSPTTHTTHHTHHTHTTHTPSPTTHTTHTPSPTTHTTHTPHKPYTPLLPSHLPTPHTPHRQYHERKFWSGSFLLLSASIIVVLVLPWLRDQLGGENALAFVLFSMFSSPIRVNLMSTHIPLFLCLVHFNCNLKSRLGLPSA